MELLEPPDYTAHLIRDKSQAVPVAFTDSLGLYFLTTMVATVEFDARRWIRTSRPQQPACLGGEKMSPKCSCLDAPILPE